MVLSKLQLRDRQEWLTKLRTRVLREKAVSVKLRPNGATLQDIRLEMGKDIEVKADADGNVTLAVIQKQQPAPAVQPA